LSLMISNGCYKKLFTQFKRFLIFSLAFCTCLGLSTHVQYFFLDCEQQFKIKL
jgi:hypothetical protein